MYEIEDDVPIPDMKNRQSRYNWHDLKPGKSFFVALEQRDMEKLKTSLRSTGQSYFKTRGNKASFTILAATKDGKEGVRVWLRELTSLQASSDENTNSS